MKDFFIGVALGMLLPILLPAMGLFLLVTLPIEITRELAQVIREVRGNGDKSYSSLSKV